MEQVYFVCASLRWVGPFKSMYSINTAAGSWVFYYCWYDLWPLVGREWATYVQVLNPPKHASCKSQPAQMRLNHNSDICVSLFNLCLTWKIPMTLQMSRVSKSIGSAATVETRGYFPWASFTDKLRSDLSHRETKTPARTKEKQLWPDKTSEVTLGKLHSRLGKKDFLYHRKWIDSLQLAVEIATAESSDS